MPDPALFISFVAKVAACRLFLHWTGLSMFGKRISCIAPSGQYPLRKLARPGLLRCKMSVPHHAVHAVPLGRREHSLRVYQDPLFVAQQTHGCNGRTCKNDRVVCLRNCEARNPNPRLSLSPKTALCVCVAAPGISRNPAGFLGISMSSFAGFPLQLAAV